MTDEGSTRTQSGLDLRAVLDLHGRNLHRVLVLSGILVVALVVGLLLTLVVARPSVQALTATAAEGTRLATWQLLLSSSWALVPVLLMFGTGVAYIGMILRYADGAHTGRAVVDGDAWRSTIRRLPQASVVVVAVGVVAVVAAGLAPVVSVVALLALAATPIVQRRWPSVTWPATRWLAWMAVPFFAAVIVAVRGAMALPEVFLGGRGARDALVVGWHRPRGRLRRVVLVLVVSAAAAMASMWVLMGVSMLVGSDWLAFLLELSGTVLVAPLPIVALLVTYRATGGTSAPIVTSPRSREPGPVMPSVLSFALLATLIVPSAAPAHAEDGPGLVVTAVDSDDLEGLQDESWTYGDGPDQGPDITGTVEPASGGDVPTGEVRLETRPEGGAFETFASVVLEVADGGAFTFDARGIPASVDRIQISYAGDELHQGSTLGPVDVEVERRAILLDLSAEPELATDPDTGFFTEKYTIGQTITVVADVHPGDDQDPFNDGVFEDGPLPLLTFERGHGDPPQFEHLGDAQVTEVEDAPGTYQAAFEYILSHRPTYHRFSHASSEMNYVPNQGGQDHVISASDIEPADSSVEILAPAEVEYGEEVTVVVRVTGPDGVPAEGTIAFEDDSGEDFSTFSAGHNLTYDSTDDHSEVEVTFCASVDETCVRSGTPRLAFADEEAEPLTIRAEYRPAGLNDDRNALNGSTSASHTMTLDTFGLGACKPLELSMTLIDGRGFENRDVDDFADARIRTDSNCEEGGYLGGTAVTLEARPAHGFELVEWRFEGREVSTDENLVFRLPDDDEEWERRRLTARYQPICYTTDVEIVGSARASGAPRAMGNPLGRSLDGHGGCELEDGTRGALYLSEVLVEAQPVTNPDTGEPDVFRSIGSMPIDHELSTRGLGGTTIQQVSFTIDRDVVVPFEFGPVCRTVLTPSGEFGGAQLLTAPNCDSPEGSGYTRNSSVTASARIDDGSVILAGWLLDGERLTAAGASSQVTFTVGAAPTTTIEPEFSWCHDVHVGLASTYAHGGAVRVETSPEPNCFDGSERWLDGTELTLNPLSGGGFEFGGWVDADGAEGPQVRGSLADDGTRQVVLDEPLDTTAHFIWPEVCSEIVMAGTAQTTSLSLDDVRFPDSGCGPGRYLDPARRSINFSSREVTRNDYEGHTGHPGNFNYTALTMEIHTDRLLTGTGWVDMRQDFARGPAWTSGQVPFECRPPVVEQAGDGSWVSVGVARCHLVVRGDLRIRLHQCQGLEPTVNITRADDESGRVYSPRDFPFDGHQWITGSVSSFRHCASGFADDTNFWYPDSEVTLRAHSPAVGLEFLDWGHVDFDTGVELFIGEDPSEGRAPLGVNVLTNEERPTVRATVNYRAHCATLRHGENIRVEGPRPNCPGSPHGELTYLVGTFVQVSADRTRGGRDFDRFRGVVAGTTGIDDNDRPAAVVLIKDDNSVSAVYPTATDRFFSDLASIGKFTLAFGSLAVTAGIPVACPPCGAALTALTASAFLIDLIPGVGGWASAVLDMINPLSVLECAAKWGFGTTGSGDGGGSAAGGATATGSTAIRSIRFAYDASTEGTERAVGTVTARSSTAAAGAGAQFAYGLYEHRIDQIDLNYQSVEQLRDTATWNSCMNDRYRAAT